MCLIHKDNTSCCVLGRMLKKNAPICERSQSPEVQMSVGLNLRPCASALGGKLSIRFDPDCGIKPGANCSPKAGLWKYAENHIQHVGIPLSCPLSSSCHLRDRAWVSFFTPSVIKD